MTSKELNVARKLIAQDILEDMYFFADGNSYRGVVQATNKEEEYILQDDVIKKIYNLASKYGVELDV